ncbi:MAG TPA: ArsI/CadI family heavy metal resistance metalloenzyme [Pirellulales bacterium]|jgi:catechol 2,3-dioxygenase-like lactoylglutathione lyase family enzyme|nr:ArsI/CadI family heavy metal resistance metalloenzyme [Pirellulales bacterium]
MAIATIPVRFHVSLNVSNLEKSVGFYRLLFGHEPAKFRNDYAKFESEDPPLVLSLEPTPPTRGGSLNHLGLRLADSAALVEIQRRFEAAGIATQREEGVECCYALQTKFWVTDPDQNLWELYILHEDLEHRGAGQTLEQMLPGGMPAKTDEPQAAPTIWRHTLGMEIPERLPEADGSVDEAHLLGTFNLALADDVRDRLLHEIRRILKPAGKLMLHTLVGDRPFAGKPNLPGPAALVEAVPVDAEVFAALERAGFVHLQLEKFGASPCFVAGGVEMRELKLWARNPITTAQHVECFVLYIGPLKQVEDDAGTVYPRGQRVRVCDRQWSLLKSGPAADAFVFFTGQPAAQCGIG